MKSRNDKVSFLKGLAVGKRSLSELGKQTFELFEQLEPGKSFFKRSTHGVNDPTCYTQANIEAFKKAHPKARITVIMDCETTAPVLRENDVIFREGKTDERDEPIKDYN